MAHDEHVGLHRREVGDGVEQRLALGLRAGGDVQVDDVGRQPLGGDLEGGARARRGLEEQVEHALAAQQRHLLHLALGDADEGLRGIEDLQQDLARQAFDGQQVLQLAVGVQLRVIRHRRSPRAPATACRSRRASGAGACRRAPRPARRTYCAAIGSWRPPRSASTASAMLRRPAVVEQLVHRRAHRAAGVEHVVHQQQVASLDVERDPRALRVVLAGPRLA